jgi:hypothetical protein
VLHLSSSLPSFSLATALFNIAHPYLEYWRTESGNLVSEIPVSEILQSSLAAFNLPETTAGIESYRAGRARDISQNSGLPPPAGVSGVSTRPQIHPRTSLSRHCRNITTLRHELEAINTDISRVLSSLHDLRREFPVSRPALQRSMDTATDALRNPPVSGNVSMPALAGNQGHPGSNPTDDWVIVNGGRLYQPAVSRMEVHFLPESLLMVN